ncbi:hypothetical protein EII23_00715 [Desulfovibrio sp. OH1186_COT-070]|nr:hypothetical protein EII24_00715 [Desulfovibrio sp. OH1209_COT-279]RRD88530.1 hypothetical protein EII23_00715 [Desulfovibrio sp. OH1186_COT-070]
MSNTYMATNECPPAATRTPYTNLGSLSEETQVTIRDTGWSEEDQERMRLAGFDGVDMVMAWYS